MNVLTTTPAVRPLTLPVLLSALLFAGCEQEPQIVRQQVPKPKAPPAADGMLAALAPIGDNGWFFKLSGPKDAVAAEAERFRGLLKSLKIVGDRPSWTAPSGWNEQPASGMRAATFTIGNDGKSLECTVIPLPARDGTASSDEYLLENVNRWRKQLGLNALSSGELQTSLETEGGIFRINLADGTPVTWVELEGTQSGGGMAPFAGSAPFAAMGDGAAAGPQMPPKGPAGPPQGPVGPAGPPVTAGGSASETAAGSSELPEMTFAVPDGWVPGALKPFRKVSWNVSDGGASAEAYISALGAAGADVAQNVNRWRSQAGLAPISDPAELDKTIEKISVDGQQGDLVILQGSDPEKTVLGAIVVRDGTGWFFKMAGAAAAKPAQQDAFRKFVASVKFR
ncbi:hypothetical protein GC176_24330 [bacterium]|nr:hypothetical protein [bacterium]